METNQLKSFLCIVETGSISRAAEKVHLTQPAVTKQIRALERELKVRLFDRTGRGVKLTAAGAALHDYSLRSLALLEECRHVLADMEAGVVGQLVIGAGATTSIFQLPGWLQSLKTVLPGIDVVVRTGTSREIVSLTLEREVDMGLVTTPVQHPDLEITRLFEEEIVLVARPHTPLVGGLEDDSKPFHGGFLPYPLILFPRGSGFRNYLDRVLNSAGIEMQVKMETDSVEAIKSFVAIGLGASFLPAGAVATEIAAGLLQRVQISGLPKLQRQTSVMRRTDRHLGVGAEAFLRILKAPVDNE